MLHFKHISLSSALFIILSVLPLHATPIILDQSFQKISVGIALEYLEDKKGLLTIDDVKANQYKKRWIESNEGNLSFGFATSAYWIRFHVKNKTGKDLPFYLESAYALMDYIDLYLPGKNRKIEKISTGLKYSFSQRPIKYRTFVFPLQIKANAEYTCYLRLKNSGPMSIDLYLWSPEIFEKNKEIETPFLWMVYGIMLFMVLYNLLLLFSMRDLAYLYCSLYIAFFGLLIMTLNGMAFQHLWTKPGEWSKISIPVYMGIINFSIVQFAIHYLNVKQYIKNRFDKVFEKILQGMMLSGISLSVLTLVSNSYRFGIISTTTLTGINVILGTIMLSLGIFRYKSREARLFLMAFILFMIGILMFVLKTYGILPDMFLTIYGMQIGSVLNVLFLTFALTDKIKYIKNELQLLNMNLENKVIERTEELQVANDEMTVINESLIDLNEELIEARRIAGLDMLMASNVQASLLPEEVPRTKEWDVACVYKPMAGVSGDMYDFYEADEKLKGVLLLDVSGHGIASGLITMIARSVFARNFYKGQHLKLNEIFEKTNNELIREMGNSDKYLTGIMLRFQDNSIEYVNAAHTNLLCCEGQSGKVKTVLPDSGKLRGMFLGMAVTANPYEKMHLSISKNDSLVLYTDGITESINKQGNDFGSARLIASIENSAVGSAEEILKNIMKDFYSFLDQNRPEDDVTVIVLKRLV